MLAPTGTVTILFTDLVSSAELLQRAGHEDTQRISQAHQELLRDAVAAHGGQEVKWLGDGLMVAFPSSAEAVRCAIAMQQAAHRPARDERLGVRVGLNVGEALRDEGDYFGTAGVVARRLCDRGEAGQILCSALVAGLLAGRQAFQFRELGALELEGIAEAVSACEVVYQRDGPGAFLSHTPFVGRESESARLGARLEEARTARGGLVMLIGEPGIGKTRIAEEFATRARHEGATVLWGRCYEGEWAPPYGPFVEALSEYARDADPETLRCDLGYGAAPIARLVSALRGVLPDIEEPVALQPDEERFRLLDAVSQFLTAMSQRAPVVLVLDDLHWADKSTIGMLRHIARVANQQCLLLVGAYRDVELDQQHPLSEALGQFRRESEYERLLLTGLDAGEVAELLATIAEQEAPPALVDAIIRETDGNPFFIRETLLHLVETGALYRKDGRWTSDVANIEELGIPEGVRQVVGQRLSRLSEDANRLLRAASAFHGAFRYEVAAHVAGLEEQAALDAIDQALAAQVLRPGASTDTCDFTHALFRHTLYTELGAPRQVRLHRQIGEALEQAHPSTGSGHGAAEHAAEIAYHYHRSATLPGAERGVEFAIAAADRAEAAYAHEDAATFLQMALELTGETEDARSGELLLRLGEAHANHGQLEGALAAYRQAAAVARKLSLLETLTRAAVGVQRVAYRTVGDAAVSLEALALLDEALAVLGPEDSALRVMALSQRVPAAAAVASRDPFRTGGYGAYAGEKDTGLIEQAREAVAMAQRIDDPALEAMALEQFRAVIRSPGNAAERLALSTRIIALGVRSHNVQQELEGRSDRAADLLDLGEIDEVLRESELMLSRALETKLLRFVSQGTGARAGLLMAQGKLQEAEPLVFEAFRMGQEVQEADAIARFGGQLFTLRWLQGRLGEIEGMFSSAVEQSPTVPSYRAALARIHCDQGRLGEARESFRQLAAGDFRDVPEDFLWTVTMMLLSDVCAALGDRDRADLLHNLLSPFATLNVTTALVMTHGALSRGLGSVATVLRRWDDAERHFQHAIEMNTRMGFPPFVAMAQFDYAGMLLDRGRRGDRNRAAPLLEAALEQFRAIGMPGWVTRAEELERVITAGAAGRAIRSDGLTPREVEVVRLIAAGRTNTEIASELTLSVRTVARHITNIYTKIGARNKAEATSYALRHGLR